MTEGGGIAMEGWPKAAQEAQESDALTCDRLMMNGGGLMAEDGERNSDSGGLAAKKRKRRKNRRTADRLSAQR